MKKLILAFLLTAMISTSLFSQKFRFGLTASPVVNWYSIDGTNYTNDGSKFGFEYGLLLDLTIGNVERYAFASGIVINMGGGNIAYSDDSLNNSATFNTRVQYIELPLTIKLRTNEVNYITYYGLFGVTPGVTIKSRGDITLDPDPFGVSVEDINLSSDNDFNVKYEPVNVSLTIGAGIEYAMTENTAITAGIFFQNGFTNVINDDDSGLAGASDNNTRLKQIGLRLGVLF